MTFKASNIKAKMLLKEDIKELEEVKRKIEKAKELMQESLITLQSINTVNADLLGTVNYRKSEVIEKIEKANQKLNEIETEHLKTNKAEKLFQCDECGKLQSDHGYEIEEKVYCYTCLSKNFGAC